MTSDPAFDRRALSPPSTRISGSRLWLELAAGLGLAGFGAWLGLAHLQPPELQPASAGAPAEPAPPKPADATGSRTSSGTAAELSRVPAVASYTMQAKLNPSTHVLTGTQRISWTNTSRAAVSSLYFHLYLNAFKNEQSLFLRSPFNASRGTVRAQEFGYIDVKSMFAQEWPGQDLWLSRSPHSPGDPLDETDIEVPLPSPVAPGSPVTLDVTFEARLPSVVERTGYSGRFHLVAQWFPKIARLESDGTFAHFAFHPQSEFYADFGRYDVTLEVPEAFRLGATGRRVEQQVATGFRRERYVAEAVHDFAWTAWDEFALTESRVGQVAISVLTPQGYEATSRRTHEILGWSLPYLERHFGAYPYPTLTVVHPPPSAAEAGGMEYPTLITTGGAWYSPHTPLRDLDAVVVHELGHQWFYGLLASNEERWPFLDEGLNSFAEDSALRARHGTGSLLEGGGLAIAKENAERVFAAQRGSDEPVAEAAGAFSTFRNLGALVYARTATILETLARVYGRATVERALSTYAERFRFKHPTPQDFLSHLEGALGHDARVALEAALFQRGQINYVVREVQTVRDEVARGFFDKAGQRTEIRATPQPLGSALSPQRSRAVVYRHGTLELPVEVLLVAQDGQRRLEHWDGRGYYRVFEYAGTSPLSHVVVDPDHKLLLEDAVFDNYASATPASLPRVHERAAYWTELLLQAVLP